MGQISKETIEKLQKILKEEYGKDVSFSDASEMSRDLVGFFDLLAKLHHKNIQETKKDMKNSIIIIGPMCVGKSTIALKLAERLSLPNYPMDTIRGYYYLKDGMDFVAWRKLEKDADFAQLVDFYKPYEIKAVEKIVKDFPNGVIDFGAGHSHYEKEEYLNRAKEALKDHENVFLLLPTEDKELNIQILNERLTDREGEDGSKHLKSMMEVNKKFITHKSNYELAKYIIYTDGKTDDEVVEDIVGKFTYKK